MVVRSEAHRQARGGGGRCRVWRGGLKGEAVHHGTLREMESSENVHLSCVCMCASDVHSKLIATPRLTTIDADGASTRSHTYPPLFAAGLILSLHTVVGRPMCPMHY